MHFTPSHSEGLLEGESQLVGFVADGLLARMFVAGGLAGGGLADGVLAGKLVAGMLVTGGLLLVARGLLLS